MLYQISSTETRILVDITHPLPNATDGSLHEYLEKQIGPQLPVGVQVNDLTFDNVPLGLKQFTPFFKKKKKYFFIVFT